jgi:predicted lipid-binding transport protein (Tim44 family)
MEEKLSEQGRGLLQNDRTLIKGLFGFYFLCICGVLGLLGWWIARRETTASANATATGAAQATQQADVTSTAIARATEQSQYEFIERFEFVTGYWYTGPYEKNMELSIFPFGMVFTSGM